MKTLLTSFGTAAFAILASLSFSSCETTGDPTQGGLFGWSESQAQQRAAARRAHLYHIEEDTAAQRRYSEQLEAEYDALHR